MDLRRAVIVDQWALVRVGIGTILRHLSIRVVHDSAQAAEGLSEARSQDADLVVLGSYLDMSSAEAVASAVTLASAPRVICLLAQPDGTALTEALAAGAHAVLLRGGDDHELTKALRQVAGGERWVTPALSMVLAGAVSGQADPGDGSPLTPKERRVLAGLAAGRSNKELADELLMSTSTVKTHLVHIYGKLGVKSRADALVRAVELGLLG